MPSTGYSGTPLAKKPGIKEDFTIRLVNQPDHYFNLFTDLPGTISLATGKRSKKQFIHYFTKQAKELARDIASLKNEIEPNGMIWISWPKKNIKSSYRHYGRYHLGTCLGKRAGGCKSLCSV